MTKGERIRKICFRIVHLFCVHALIFFGLFIAWLAWELAAADGKNTAANTAPARYALQRTGLEERWADAPVLYFDDYFRDGHTLRIFQIGETEKALEDIQGTPGWHIAQVGARDYEALARQKFWDLAHMVAPGSDVTFDAWFYRDDYEAQYGGHGDWPGSCAGLPDTLALNELPDTLNATFAFYDRETGLFFYYEYDS